MNALIVLGCRIIHKDKWYPSEMLKMRLDKARDTYFNGDYTFIIVAGAGRNRVCSKVMKEYLTEKGVPEPRIYEEDRSMTTVENCIYSYEIMFNFVNKLTYRDITQGDDPGYIIGELKHITVVTSNFHVRRSRLIFDYYSKYFNFPKAVFIGSNTPKDIYDKMMHNEVKILATF